MRPKLMILLAIALLITGCDQFLPREKHPVRTCGDPQPIRDDVTGQVIAWARVCVTVWKVPAPYGDSTAVDEPVVTDTVYTPVR